MSFYLTILTIHSDLRWLVLLFGIVSVVIGLVGWQKQLAFRPLGRTAGIVFIATFDVQFLLGLWLYVISPIVRFALIDIRSAMKQHEARFFTVEHITIMLLALIVAHLGWRRAKAGATGAASYRSMFWWNLVALLLILAAIPWWRPLLRY